MSKIPGDAISTSAGLPGSRATSAGLPPATAGGAASSDPTRPGTTAYSQALGEILFEDSLRPLLTIMIPVYNGGKFLSSLLSVFEIILRSTPAALRDVEIVVCNNVSTDDTLQVAKAFLDRIPILRVIDHPDHKQTAEENIFRSFDHCRGEYTWALGADDIPNAHAIERVMDLIRKREYSFYVFNYPTISDTMKDGRSSNFYMTSYLHETTIISFTARYGFWFIIAGISGQIIKTEKVKGYNLAKLVSETSPIYAHVVAYMECFRDDPMLIVNEPIVFYKLTYRDVGHWQRAAGTIGVFDEFFWTLGYIRQLKYLESIGVIPPTYLRDSLDNNDFFFFRPILVICDKIIMQLKVMGGTLELRNVITRDEFDELFSYMFAVDPFIRELLWKVREVYDKLEAGRPVELAEWGRLDELFGAFAHGFFLMPMLACSHEEYEIFRIQTKYWAVYRRSRDLISDHLRQLDEPDKAPFIYIDQDLDALKARLPSPKVAEAAQKRRDAEARMIAMSSELPALRDQLGRVGNALEQTAAAQRRADELAAALARVSTELEATRRDAELLRTRADAATELSKTLSAVSTDLDRARQDFEFQRLRAESLGEQLARAASAVATPSSEASTASLSTTKPAPGAPPKAPAFGGSGSGKGGASSDVVKLEAFQPPLRSEGRELPGSGQGDASS